MKIGFTTIYSFRPHVEQMFFLSKLLTDAGHESAFMVCNSAVDACYAQLLKGTTRLTECPKCILGNFRTYPVRDIWSIDGKVKAELTDSELKELAASSSYTLLRIETPEEARSEELTAIQRRLHGPIGIVLENTRQWIRRQGLDAVICFNGRIDLTRAVIRACEDVGIPYITCERSLYGHGLHLLPNANCLSLRELDRLATLYRDAPLTLAQARHAAKLAAARFLNKDVLEYRLYNPNPRAAAWPREGVQEKVLIVPSSRNEFMGHPDYTCDWQDNTQALETLMASLGIHPDQCVLRCHPNWAEPIGVNTGARIEMHYRQWGARSGVLCIASRDKASTNDLINQANLVVVNGSSCGYEAGICGKKVVCLGPSAYQQAGFAIHIRRDEEWLRLQALEQHDPETTVRRSLRYIYLRAHRLPQYVDYVRAQSTTKFHYYKGADPNRLIRMLETGVVDPDDPVVADTTAGEDEVLESVLKQDWAELYQLEEKPLSLPELKIGRRRAFRWIDPLRGMFPKGDL